MAISILRARKLLGKQSNNLTDEQITNIVCALHGFAEIVADLSILCDSNKSKGVIEPQEKEPDNGTR